MKKQAIFSAILLFVIVYICCFGIFAIDLSDLNANTSVSHWAFSTQNGHMGTKDLTYAYSSSSVESSYSSYVNGGIGLWG